MLRTHTSPQTAIKSSARALPERAPVPPKPAVLESDDRQHSRGRHIDRDMLRATCRDPDAALQDGAARLRDRAAAARGRRLAGRRTSDPRQGLPAGRVAVAVDVGEAMVSYLRRRPRCESRALFLRMTAPLQGLAPHTAGWIVREACTRAGLPRVGAHRLRHTAATEMLRQGASLAEIGQVLRHRAEDHGDIRQGRPRGAACARAAVALAGRWRGMTLRDVLADYLRLRRRLGFEMPQDGRLLEDFVEFLEQAGARRITTDLALMWARMPVDAHPHRWRQRLSACAGSRAISRRSTLRARFPPRTCCPAIVRGSRHTSTPRRRSRR